MTDPTTEETTQAEDDAKKYPLLPFFHPFLTKRPEPFDFEKESAIEVANLLKRRMFQLEGVGLSANQIGLNHRVFVMGNEEYSVVAFNPTIVSTSPETVPFEEQCLSFPGFSLVLQRPEWIVLSYQTEAGEIVTAKFSGLTARIAQHEYDHMEGITFTHHASNMKLKRELTKWKKRRVKHLRQLQGRPR